MKLWLIVCLVDGGGDGLEVVVDVLYDVFYLFWCLDVIKICVLVFDVLLYGFVYFDNFLKCFVGYDLVGIVFEMVKKGIFLYLIGCGLFGNVMDFFMVIGFMIGG